MQLAAEVQSQARLGKQGGSGVCRRAAHEDRASEQALLVLERAVERIDRGIVRKRDQPFTKPFSATGDISDPVQHIGPVRHKRVVTGIRAVVELLLRQREFAVARHENIAVDGKQPDAFHRLDQIGSIDEAPGMAAIRGGQHILAVDQIVGRAKGRFPMQFRAVAEKSEAPREAFRWSAPMR